MRFRPAQHLRRQTDIRAAREEGARIDCRAYTIWWRPRVERADPSALDRRQPAASLSALGSGRSTSEVLPRVGVVASTAAVGPAVRRNRAKRRLREIFRRNQELLPRDCDLLVVARSGVIHRPFAELDKKFVEACHVIAGSGRTGKQP